jgi:hypothetical protein
MELVEAIGFRTFKEHLMRSEILHKTARRVKYKIGMIILHKLRNR